MQDYFEHDERFKDVSNLSFRLTFVGTIFNILINLLGPLGQILMTYYGARTVLFISITCCSTGLLLASFSTQVHKIESWNTICTNQGYRYGIYI
jgi:ABC-type bacteriocin/lantibiotic exporter with double-glycine peptidase domain